MVRNKRTGFGLQAVLASLLIAVIFLGGCTTTQNEKVYHVGVLSGLSFVADITDGLKAKMTELGYTEGKNIVYDVQKTDFDMTAYRSALKKFVDDKVDVIVVFPTEASMEAKKATEGTGVPVVFTFALIEGMGLVDSIREPGGNITGVRYPGPDIVLQRFEVMQEMVPQAKRFLVPYQRGYPIVDPQLEVLRPAAEAAGITLIELPASNATELQAYFDARNTADAGFDVILIIVEPLGVTPDAFGVLGKFAYEHKLPIGGALMAAGNHTSIFGVNVNNIAVGRQTAPLVDKVLRGTPAGTIPVVSADSYFQINYKAAQAFGLNMSEGLLARADEIIR